MLLPSIFSLSRVVVCDVVMLWRISTLFAWSRPSGPAPIPRPRPPTAGSDPPLDPQRTAHGVPRGFVPPWASDKGYGAPLAAARGEGGAGAEGCWEGGGGGVFMGKVCVGNGWGVALHRCTFEQPNPPNVNFPRRCCSPFHPRVFRRHCRAPRRRHVPLTQPPEVGERHRAASWGFPSHEVNTAICYQLFSSESGSDLTILGHSRNQ